MAKKKPQKTLAHGAKTPKTSDVSGRPEASSLPRYASFRLQKRIRHSSEVKLTGAFRLFHDSLHMVVQHWKLLGGIGLVYLLLSLLFVGLELTTDLSTQREGLAEFFGSGFGQLGVGLGLFVSLVGSAGASSERGILYQNIVVLMTSLAVIWSLRQLLAGEKIGIRDAFYKGMYPLVPVLLVMLVIVLQLVPIAIGSFLYSVMFGAGVAVTGLEQFVWGSLIFLLVLLSLYLLTSSVFALYIVTLPDIKPVQALKSARELVRYRRWSIMRKLLFLPVALLLTGALVMVPLLWLWTPLGQWAFLVLTAFALILTHTYVYNLYRELL